MDDGFITVEIKGLDELQRKLEELPLRVAKKGLRRALAVGAQVFKYAMYTLAPRYSGGNSNIPSGFLAEHFGVRVSLGRDPLTGTAYIGPDGKMDYPDEGGGYRSRLIKKTGKLKKVGRVAVATVARLLEFGTSKMAKKPFMTQAFESKKADVISVVANALAEAIEDAS